LKTTNHKHYRSILNRYATYIAFINDQTGKFDFNAETAVNNSFQVNAADGTVQEKALHEFEAFIAQHCARMGLM
jgi:hypothetical protein